MSVGALGVALSVGLALLDPSAIWVSGNATGSSTWAVTATTGMGGVRVASTRGGTVAQPASTPTASRLARTERIIVRTLEA